jgi:hypothetical protein
LNFAARSGVKHCIQYGAGIVLVAQQINLRRFGVPQSLATRWDRLVKGISSVLRGNATTVVLYTIGVWTLEVVALASMVRSFSVSLTPPEVRSSQHVGFENFIVAGDRGWAGASQ